MELEIRYADAVKRYPKQVKQAMAAIRDSRSKYKDYIPENLAWRLFWCQKARAIGADELFKAKPLPEFNTADEYFESVRKDINATLTVAGWTSPSYYHSNGFKVVPKEIEQWYKHEWVKGKLRGYVGISGKDWEEQAVEILKKLVGKGGFVGILNKGDANE